MRKKSKKQMPLMPAATDHPQAIELENISRILDANPIICDLAMQDLCEVSKKARRSGARGMTADQVVRAAIVKQMLGFTYKELGVALLRRPLLTVCGSFYCFIPDKFSYLITFRLSRLTVDSGALVDGTMPLA
jgi:hypothetical protein